VPSTSDDPVALFEGALAKTNAAIEAMDLAWRTTRYREGQAALGKLQSAAGIVERMLYPPVIYKDKPDEQAA
jgi:hypothetical protein